MTKQEIARELKIDVEHIQTRQELLDKSGEVYLQSKVPYIDFFVNFGAEREKLEIKLDSFKNLQCSIGFERCVFSQEALLAKGSYRYLGFFECEFLGRFDLSGSSFEDGFSARECVFREVDFSECVFNGKAEFCGTRFMEGVRFYLRDGGETKGTSFNADADFSEVVFDKSHGGHSAEFKYCQFGGEARFDRARFYTPAYFDHIEFNGGAHFCESYFAKEVYFYDVFFGQVPFLCDTRFECKANFSYLRFGFDYETIEKDFKDNPANARYYRQFFGLISRALAQYGGDCDSVACCRKMECYCKELELGIWAKTFSEQCCKWVLLLVRKTSDHYVSLPRVLACMLGSLGMFWCLSCTYQFVTKGALDPSTTWIFSGLTLFYILRVLYFFEVIKLEFLRGISEAGLIPDCLLFLSVLVFRREFILELPFSAIPLRHHESILQDLLLSSYVVMMMFLFYSLCQTFKCLSMRKCFNREVERGGFGASDRVLGFGK